MLHVMQQVYTVGHSSQSIEEFIASLQRHAIEVVADVRSRPYSRRFAHFSRESLQSTLKATDIGYVFLGRELGARRDEPECYVDGQAVYDRIVTLPAFAEGINRLLDGARKYRVALMCAEQDPLTCHRTRICLHRRRIPDRGWSRRMPGGPAPSPIGAPPQPQVLRNSRLQTVA
jgi:uncharacterized protein (DUF488 family)